MSQKTYAVNKRRQLVDLNGDSINFDLTFTCTSKDSAPFEVLVVDQTTLDSTPTLQYKKANGTISGNIVADKNVYQNYFLILKADKPCEVTVKTIKKEISPNLPKPRGVTPRPPVQQYPLKSPTCPVKSKFKIIALVVVVLGGAGLLYHFYTQSKKDKTSTVPSVVPTSPTPSVASFSPSSSALLAKLNGLPVEY